ncbi:four-carbon acid sugar kinase family protein [Xenorhabdus sp. PB61.4]|uniref:3-oxo-tetronate kinase n=1 Tax=Xenorhabdus sp. PB61.4 TaxID=2788940 RepID=UPI001E4AE081|nr:3-oxo-tetronate kinase [Xenorhabdus sp. PB61.4]MCC8364888.1 four-carbon acid sugar kinase family protein [Xenorhabdus sp. PB61.4]
MAIKLGVIADDFTGATDIASFMVQNGWKVSQLLGVPNENTLIPYDVDVVVIGLKSRSCSTEEAIHNSLKSCRWLRDRANCRRFFFKYCSTFDSTPKGNIGPVIDALMDELQLDLSLICPAIPINGRTVVHGHLFVNGQLLNESGMQYHPVTPMKDANLLRLIEQQSKGMAGLVDLNCVRQGGLSIRNYLTILRCNGIRYAIVDAMMMEDLMPIAEAVSEMTLVTGGSGLGAALASYHTGLILYSEYGLSKSSMGMGKTPPVIGRKAVILSGSCSAVTYQQVMEYKKFAPAIVLDVEECMNNPEYSSYLVNWVIRHQKQSLAPMLYSTQSTDILREIQNKHGVIQSSNAVERIFAQVSSELICQGFNTFIIAGGETSGQVVKKLGIHQLSIEATIAPGVPWVHDEQSNCWLVLKSGNFGAIDFFKRAQEL